MLRIPSRLAVRLARTCGMWRWGYAGVVMALVGSLSAPGAQAADATQPVQATGLRPPTAAERVWMDRNLPVTRRVLPNALGLERINRHLRAKGQPEVRAATVPVGSEPQSTGRAGIAGGMDLSTAATKGAVQATLPSAVDNSTLPSFPPVRSQGSIGSCAAFSTTYYAGTHMTGLARGWNNRDNADNTRKLSPKWTYNFANDGEDGGSWFSTVMDVLMKQGCPTWSEFPYVGDGTNPANYLEWSRDPAVWRHAVSNRFAEIGRVQAVDTTAGLASLKALLANGYAILYATHVFSWQFMPFTDDPATTADNGLVGRQCCWKVSAESSSGHAMTLVGYNDDVWTDINKNGAVDPGEKGALKVVNSWGASGWWQAGSSDGFGWIAYDALRPTSAVTGIGSTDRQEAFWNSEVYWLTARASYTPTLLGQFTLRSARRYDLRLRVGVSAAGTTTPERYFPTTTTFGWENGSDTYWPQALSNVGGAYAFDGGTTAVDGTFALDLTDLVETGDRRYYVAVQDTAAGWPATLSDFRLVDAAGTVLATAVAGIPGSADNSTALAYAGFTVAAPPEITSAATAIGTVGVPFSYAITATNSPSSFGANGLPPGLGLDPGTGVISGTPGQAGAGYVVALSATNAGGVGTATLTITVNAQTIATPAITSATTAAGTVGQTFSYTITATNAPTSFGAGGLPAGLEVDTGTGAITGVPVQAGTFVITLNATNAGGTGSEALTLTVSPAPALVPAITSSNLASGVSSSAFTYRIQATNNPTSFGAANLPGGLAVDTVTGDITGTLPAAGSYSITLSASNTAGTGYLQLLLTVTGSNIYGPPNDAFANRIVLNGASADATGTNVNASAESGEPAHIGSAPAARSVWWSWTAPASGPVAIDTIGSDFDTVLAAYTGAAVNALAVIARDDDSGGSGTSRITFEAVAGTAYQIAVDGFDGATGQIALALRLTPVAGPANDAFADRIALSGSSASAGGANQGASAEAGEPGHAGFAATHSVWWTWTAPAAGQVTIDTTGSDFDTLLAVYAGSTVGALTLLAADDQSGGNNTSRVSFPVTSGAVCQIAVDGWNGQTGGIQLHIALGGGAPANDAFASRITLSGTAITVSGSNAGASAESGEPRHAGYTARRSVWWTWTAPEDGIAIVQTVGSTFDTLLAVYTGTTLAGLAGVASNDDRGADVTSRLTFYAEAGARYQIAVDGYGGASGTIALNLVLSTLSANDDFADRTTLSGSGCATSGGNVGATAEAGEPDHNFMPATRSVWWTWTAPAAGMVTITTAGSSFDTILAVYRGNTLGGLVDVVANDDAASDLTSQVRFFATAGSVFQIAVDGYSGAVGRIELALTQEPSAVLYSADFEDFPSGFQALNGYDGWQTSGLPGSGISGVFSLGTQTAWIGYNYTDVGFVYAFRPINYDAVAAGTPQIEFSVDLAVHPSTTADADVFGFALYNTDADYLALIAFDNSDGWVYRGDGTSNWYAVETFDTARTYHLAAVLDFARNRWSATLDGVPLFADAVLHAGSATLNLGDVDAVWLITAPESPGDNFMVFDNYRLAITGQEAPTITTASPLPAATVGVAYNQTLTATGGMIPYSWSVAAGTPPPGVYLNGAVLTGSPQAAGTAEFTVRVTGADGMSSTQDFALTVAPGTQGLAFADLPPVTYGVPDFAAGAVASSGLPVSYGTSNPAVATVVGGLIHVVGTGTSTITATQGGDANWLPAAEVQRLLTVAPASLTIRAENKIMVVGTVLPVLTASYTGLVNGDTPADLDTAVVLATTATADSPLGTYPITASGAADVNYTITHVDGTLTVSPPSHTVRFLAGPHGGLSGPAEQTVPHGDDATPVTAEPDFLYVFDAWLDDGVPVSSSPTLTLPEVIADHTLTARFRPAGLSTTLEGRFRAVVGASSVADPDYRGWWDFSGVYATTAMGEPLSVAGQPLVLNLVHDSKGRITGSASYGAGKAAPVSLRVAGSVRGRADAVVLKVTLRNTAANSGVRVALVLDLALDPETRQLVGSVSGGVTDGGVWSDAGRPLTLPVPPAMVGTWTLQFDLAPGTRGRITGQTWLAFSGEPLPRAEYAVRGVVSGSAVSLVLTGVPDSLPGRAMRVKARITPMEGGWARLDSFAANGYGQRLRW